MTPQEQKNILTMEELEKIFEEADSKWEGDNAYQGLQILSKYSDNLIQGAGHDVIYSCNCQEILDKGFTREDAEKLALLNWSIVDEGFECYV